MNHGSKAPLKLDHDQACQAAVGNIIPAKVNDLIYRPVPR
jgi:hypothetical protein